MNQEKIGKFIAKCRKDKNLTQGELADKLNISNKTISKWETGRGMPDASIMLELCEYLGITVNELLSGEKLEEGEYKEKANENIINIAKESEKNKKVKNKIIIVLTIIIIFSILLLIKNIIYRNFEVTLEYDNRLIKCEKNNEDIICSFNGISLVTLYSEYINIDDETLIFINGKMLLQNKIKSHYESWDSMAELNNGNNTSFNTEITINKSKDIEDCKEKIKVYYTKTNVNKIRSLGKEELQKVIEESNLMLEI